MNKPIPDYYEDWAREYPSDRSKLDRAQARLKYYQGLENACRAVDIAGMADYANDPSVMAAAVTKVRTALKEGKIIGCRPEDRAMLGTKEGKELIRAAISCLEVEPSGSLVRPRVYQLPEWAQTIVDTALAQHSIDRAIISDLKIALLTFVEALSYEKVISAALTEASNKARSALAHAEQHNKGE